MLHAQLLRTLIRTTALAALALFAASTDIGAATPTVHVRLYDAITTDATARAEAMRIAAAILEDAGLTVQWRDCTLGGDRFCDASRETRGVIVRIIPTSFVIAPSESLISSVDAADDSSMHLGFAVVDPAKRRGVMATVFRDNVLRVTHRAGVEYRELLGLAIAHEIGHLLLGGPGHGDTGLMRAVWTDAELNRNAPEDRSFTAIERERLKAVSSRSPHAAH